MSVEEIGRFNTDKPMQNTYLGELDRGLLRGNLCHGPRIHHEDKETRVFVFRRLFLHRRMIDCKGGRAMV